ncbi:iron-sulfur cluster biosynthesis family protein [Niallia sp. 01092]|uniref:iron-sulfur cluster biosynthesis family protein n=1 Tax=unclassified Niallia TaxID=2837522 RepID=UPI003FD2419B
MQITEDAVKKVLDLMEQQDNREMGLRIKAMPAEDKVDFQLYWESEELPSDKIIQQEGLKIFLDDDSSKLLEEMTIFYTVQDGKEGLFIMNAISDCSSCSTVCF